MGLVSQIFNGEILHMARRQNGHRPHRYSTTGSSHLRNAQPLTGRLQTRPIAIAHNGNLTNAAKPPR
jgi:amidophosphoribosyltransferase